MILAAQYARENNVPYFGICLGMQIAVIEYARNVAGIPDANSGEFNELCKNKVIDFMPGQATTSTKGGTARLGAYPALSPSCTTPGAATVKWSSPSVTAITLRAQQRLPRKTCRSGTYRFRSVSRRTPCWETVELSRQTPSPWAFSITPSSNQGPAARILFFKGFIAAALERSKN